MFDDMYETVFGKRGSIDEAYNMLKVAHSSADTELFVHWLGELGDRVKRKGG